MAAGLNDKFRKVGASTVTTLAAPGKAIGATSINVGSTTNYPTDTGIVIAIRQVDTDGKLVPGTYTTWNAIVTSATTLSISSTPRKGTDRVYPAASTTQVYMVVSSDSQNDLIDGILEEHNQDGSHGAITATSVTAPTGTITSLSVTNLTVGSQTPSADWTATSVPNTVTLNGNRSYTMVFNGTDLTGAINPGTRIRTTRTTAAPTQCTSLNGTNQYWVKTSPNKLTFTDDFVVYGYFKISSYSTLGTKLLTRYNGTSGWELSTDSSGRVVLAGYNASGSNYSAVRSYQSIPLNKWVHVALQLDMSAFTATSTTSYVMIDGADCPAEVFRGGTNPTALVQAGNLEVGSWNGGANLSAVKIAQVGVFNAKVTQSTIQSYISQGLSGSETNLASGFSFNGVATDLNTTTPNDLTAQNSATATNADSPFGGQANGTISSTLDYGIVQSSTFSTNTTLVVQVPEGCTIPTSGGITAMSYSSINGYGFPSDEDKHTITTVFMGSYGQGTPTANTVYNPSGIFVIAPAGKQILAHRGSSYTARNAAGAADIKVMFGTSSTTGGIEESRTGHYFTHPGLGDFIVPNTSAAVPVSNSVATPYYLQIQTTQSSVSTISYRGDLGGGMLVKFKNAYL